MVTWGNSPEDALPITGRVPDPGDVRRRERREAMERALAYMGLTPGMPLAERPVDRVFIGSCTNARIEDLRSAAAVVARPARGAGRRGVGRPGLGPGQGAGRSRGLDRIFSDAGFQWRHAGCSMCLATNGDQVAPGERCASTSNRNFVGRQGPGRARTS